MSEHEHSKPKHESHEAHHELAGEHQKHLERIRKEAEKAHENAPKSEEIVDELRSKVESHAVSGKEALPSEKEASHSSSHHYVNQKELKADSFNKSMQTIRKRLSKPDKVFSKVIHTKAIENLSEVGSKTVARPSGMLGGGIFALAGSAFLLYMSSHYGFEYNYLIFFMLFVGGFFVGMLVEILVRTLFRRKNSA